MTEKYNGTNLEFKPSSEELKKNEEQKVLKDTKKRFEKMKEDIAENENFEYMKKSMEELDKIKKKINGLDIPEETKNKLLDLLKKVVYDRDNSEEKYYGLVLINGIFDNFKDMKFNNVSDIEDYITFWINNLPLDLREKVSEFTFGVGGLGFIIAISAVLISGLFEGLAIGVVYGVGVSFMYFGLLGYLATNFFKGEYDNEEKNKLFDTLNDIYPQINRKEFDKIFELYKDGEFDMDKFSTMMSNYEEDGKITKEERKKIEQFLGIQSSK